MKLENDIESIRNGIHAGKFSNEASVSQGIVLRLLRALSWPTDDTDIVWPEYTLKSSRVDYALCSPAKKPLIFIEVKQIGQSEGAERQLFEYAFHIGVPMAILTDGQQWNFFLPAEQGDYKERRVYKLDIVERDVHECVERLTRYLSFERVSGGLAIQAARDDYKNVSKDRQIQATIPNAWAQLINEQDEMLLEIIADRVESLCGFKPSQETVGAFLKTKVAENKSEPVARVLNRAPTERAAPSNAGKTGFYLQGKFYQAATAVDALRQFFQLMINNDETFAERFAGLPKHGNKRRYLADDPQKLFPGRPDLSLSSAEKVASGWYIGTNNSKASTETIIKMACGVAGLEYGKEVVLYLN